VGEHERVALVVPVPSAGLRPGDIGTVVHIHGRGQAFEVEFFTLAGDTIDVLTLDAAQVRPLGHDEVASARRRMAG
jgi:hypothetical protein